MSVADSQGEEPLSPGSPVGKFPPGTSLPPRIRLLVGIFLLGSAVLCPQVRIPNTSSTHLEDIPYEFTNTLCV
ncbi:hypothetical protein PGTUg99_013749 [Puccinia graminis f. sp. tritici]|uniref:Uncharacterized protein n=1 Tax=Puccinia graminis f. sp. tritici TaxID=56615 RepID=A0A5B0SIE6_PUCGR|nr:hypothetical protein PGTUg99_013749 [Puccinia graminis f. sp. tritici]